LLSKLQRRRAILENLKCTKDEHSQYKTIIEAIGDSEELDLDWDDLEELIGLKPDHIETLLEEMSDLSLIEVYWEDSIIM
jgi:hypothetical protein